MYQVIFFMYSGDTVYRRYNSYPTKAMIIRSGMEWDAIASYEVHY